LNKLEKLVIEAQAENIDIQHAELPANVSGLYDNDGIDDPLIVINALLKTQSEQACVMAEELGHHYTSCGNLLTDSTVDHTVIQQQELRAKRWATKKLVSIKAIIKAYDAGCQSLYEFSEYLEVTEDFFRKALNQYANMYGAYKQRGKYIIYFDPPAVLKLFE
jgi:hypothetical protein